VCVGKEYSNCFKSMYVKLLINTQMPITKLASKKCRNQGTPLLSITDSLKTTIEFFL
jgi:hypothetical protein